MSDTLGNLDPADISVDDEGRIVVKNQVLAAAIRTKLAERGDVPGQPALRNAEAAFNLIACGNHCVE